MTSTHDTTRDLASPQRSAPGRLTWRGILRSEWLRLVTTRSTWVTLVAAGVLMALVGVLAAAVSTGSVDDPAGGGGPAPGFSASDPVATLTAGSTLVVLVIGVLGVMLGAREHGSGFARTTYAAVPRRWPVLVARALVLAATSAVVVGVGVAVAFVVGGSVLRGADAPMVAIGDGGVLRALLGSVGYLVGIGLLGLALGTLTRSLGPGIGVVVALVTVVPGLGSVLLPDDWQGALDVLPSEAAASFVSVGPTDGLGVAAGVAVFALWCVGALVLAATALVRRDV